MVQVLQEKISDSMSFSPLAEELFLGLSAKNKYINPKFFYNEKGSQLFDEITRTKEYYPTRTEKKVLDAYANDIAECVGPDAILIEPGAGACEKVKHLLPAVRPHAYVPQDISAEFLQKTADNLKEKYDWLHIFPLVGDFAEGLNISRPLPSGRKVVFYPGSTIGNFLPSDAEKFLRQLHDVVGHDGGVIIGVDLQKDPEILNAAYNDKAGVTAEFNLNILDHANNLLNADFDLNAFKHLAFYNEHKSRIEMHLVSRQNQTVQCQGKNLFFAESEKIHTEFSYKYTVDSFAELAAKAGFTLSKSWLDTDKLFSVHYLTVMA